jgi:hypothetical protein
VPNKENSKFFDFNTNEKVYSLVFKLAIISDTESRYVINTKNKTTTTLFNMLKETATQQDVYLRTISPRGYPITISVVDFSYFNKETAKILLEKFYKICGISSTKLLINSLFELINHNDEYKLGVITMELVNRDFTTIGNIYKGLDRTVSAKMSLFHTNLEYVIAQMIILFVRNKIIHYDLHKNNAFGNTTISDENNRSFIIDFERVFFFSEELFFANPISIEYLARYYDMDVYRDSRPHFFSDLGEIITIDVTNLYDDEDKCEKIIRIIYFINYIDRIINKILFEAELPQCKFFIDYFEKCIKEETSVETGICYRISNIIQELTKYDLDHKPQNITSQNIKKLIDTNQMFYISPNLLKQKNYKAFFRNNPKNWAKEISDEETDTDKNYLLPIDLDYALPDSTVVRGTAKRSVTIKTQEEKERMEQEKATERNLKKYKKEQKKREKEKKKKLEEMIKEIEEREENRKARAELRAYKTAKEIGTPEISNNLGGKRYSKSKSRKRNRRTQKLRQS